MKTKDNKIADECKSINEALKELHKISTDPEVINLLYYIQACNRLILQELE